MGKDVEDVQVVRPESLEQIVTCAGANSLRHLANGDRRSSAESRCVSGALVPLFGHLVFPTTDDSTARSERFLLVREDLGNALRSIQSESPTGTSF